MVHLSHFFIDKAKYRLFDGYNMSKIIYVCGCTARQPSSQDKPCHGFKPITTSLGIEYKCGCYRGYIDITGLEEVEVSLPPEIGCDPIRDYAPECIKAYKL